MRLKIDEKADALYLRLDNSKVMDVMDSQEVALGVILDYNRKNQVVGIGILRLSKRAPKLNPRELQLQLS